MLNFTSVEQAVLTGGLAARLLLASALGAMVGLDREIRHKPSGLRTNLLICFGSALFTFLSPIIAGETGNNKGQIAANIVQGIGFLGAGLILHNRNRVSGLTSAATVFAVASIGMACGAGLYGPAVFSAGLVLVALEGVGVIERRGNFKLYARVYEVRGQDAEAVEAGVLAAMDAESHRLADVERTDVGGLVRLSFPLQATTKGHVRFQTILRGAEAVHEVLVFSSWEDE